MLIQQPEDEHQSSANLSANIGKDLTSVDALTSIERDHAVDVPSITPSAQSSLIDGIATDRLLLAEMDATLRRKKSLTEYKTVFSMRQQLNQQIAEKELQLREIEKQEMELEQKRRLLDQQIASLQKTDDRQFYGKIAASGIGSASGIALLVLASMKLAWALLLGPSGLLLLSLSIAVWSTEVKEVMVAKVQFQEKGNRQSQRYQG